MAASWLLTTSDWIMTTVSGVSIIMMASMIIVVMLFCRCYLIGVCVMLIVPFACVLLEPLMMVSTVIIVSNRSRDNVVVVGRLSRQVAR